jgi:CarD family transcriptional regulator
MSKNGLAFTVGDHVVYPAHGVGRVQGIETQEVAGLKLEVYVITFDHEKMTLRVPTGKAKTAGLRPLAETNVVSQALNTLKGRARVKRTMWSRRAQEYEAKINSGDLISIAEVVRDLHRAENQPEQSYYQLGRPDLERRSGARSAPRREPARAVLFRAPAL